MPTDVAEAAGLRHEEWADGSGGSASLNPMTAMTEFACMIGLGAGAGMAIVFWAAVYAPDPDVRDRAKTLLSEIFRWFR